jgi:hypothetical protein
MFMILFRYYDKYDFHDFHEHIAMVNYKIYKFEIVLCFQKDSGQVVHAHVPIHYVFVLIEK